MEPPDDTTWTGVIESRQGSRTVQTPTGGQTVTGGGSANIQLALSSEGAHIQRAVVVEGDDLSGPVVAEETCARENGEGEQETRAECETGNRSESHSQSVNDGGSSRGEHTDAESIARTILDQLGID